MSDKIRYAKYEVDISNGGEFKAILKDGHTMFPQDIAKDLNRKSYLEEQLSELQSKHDELEGKYKTALKYIKIAETEKSKHDMAGQLADRLQPYAQGCFSGNVSEWPELKPLLAEIYELLKG